jgi:hypothetical protein
MSNEMPDEFEYTLNIQGIRDDKNMRATVRMLASFIMSRGLVTIAECIEQISDSDLYRITGTNFEDPDIDPDDLDEIGVISMLFNHAEGGTIGDEQTYLSESLRLMNSTIVMLTIESLARKGMIDVQRSNYTLDDSEAEIFLQKAEKHLVNEIERKRNEAICDFFENKL